MAKLEILGLIRSTNKLTAMPRGLMINRWQMLKMNNKGLLKFY